MTKYYWQLFYRDPEDNVHILGATQGVNTPQEAKNALYAVNDEKDDHVPDGSRLVDAVIVTSFTEETPFVFFMNPT
jgi:hypothetical protein